MKQKIELFVSDGKIQCTTIGIKSTYIEGRKNKITGLIDTGCMKTRVSICDLYSIKNIQDILWHKQKMIDVCREEYLKPPRDRKVKLISTRGVNDDYRNKIKNLYDLSDKELLSMRNVGFNCKLDDLSINGLHFGSTEVNCMYNPGTPTLIGMSLLGNLDWYFNSEEEKFTLCLPNDVNQYNNKYKLCLEKIQELFLIKRLTIGNIRETLLIEYPKDIIDSAFNEVLHEMSYTDRDEK